MSSSIAAFETLSRTYRVPHAAPYLVLAVFVAVHLALAIAIDSGDSDTFTRADRALERFNTLRGLLAVTSVSDLERYLANHGVVGDYAAHALLYMLGGRAAVVAAQIGLALFAAFCVYRIGIVLGLTQRNASIAMAVYLCLPHTLVFPHQLATEALHMPLIVVSTYYLATSLLEGRHKALMWSALWLGIATLIRPITLLWPLFAALALLTMRRPRHACAYVGIAYLPILAWMAFIATQTGELGLGESGHSMGRNLYERALRITDTMPTAAREAARAAHLDGRNRSLDPLGYVRFSLDYPLPSLKHFARDATTFFAKSGVERVTIDYLGDRSSARAVQDPRRGWRVQLERHGLAHTMSFLWQTLGSVLIISFIGAVLMLVLFGLALFGAVHCIKSWRRERTASALVGCVLSAFTLYIFVFSHVLNAMQSRQRAPAEFAIVLLAAIGAVIIHRHWLRRHERKLHSRATVAVADIHL